MQFHFQPTKWSCLPTSFAMVLGVTPKDIIDWCGHDGSEIIWPELEDPMKRRAFCLQEMVDFSVLQMRYPVIVQVDASYGPQASDTLFNPFHEGWHERVSRYLETDAVLLGLTKSGKHHAVAWDASQGVVLDPSKGQAQLDEYELEAVVPIFC